MSERTILSINAPNIITIMIMILFGQGAIMLLKKAAAKHAAPAKEAA